MKLLPAELCDAIAAYLEAECESLTASYRVRPEGPIDDEEIAVTVEHITGWIAQLRGAPTSGGDPR